MFPSYRNQSVDLQSRSTDQFLYNGDIGRERVNEHWPQIDHLWTNDYGTALLSDNIDLKHTFIVNAEHSITFNIYLDP